MRHLNATRLIFILQICFSFTFCAISQAEDAEKPKAPPKMLVPVVTALVTKQMLAPTIKIPGTIVSRQQAELPAEVDGRLVWVAEVGTSIKFGEAVARLDDTLYRLRASENKATVIQKKNQLEYLEKELARLEELEKSDFSSKTELDKIRLERDLASSELVVANAKVKVDEETLARYSVRAPFDGQVINRSKREGEWINGGDTVVTLSNTDHLEVEARVNEGSVHFIKPGDILKIYQREDTATGVVRAIVGVGDVQSHLFDIRIDLKNAKWLAGQSVRVEVPNGKAEEVVAVPRDALILRRAGISLFKIGADNIAQKIDVTSGIASGDLIQVKGDVVAGDTVVVRGNERLRPGQEVKILPGKRE